MPRRQFLSSLGVLGLGVALAPRLQGAAATPSAPGVAVSGLLPGEDLFGYIGRQRGTFAEDLYKQLLGAANEFKEGDAAQGIHAADEASRRHARTLLGNTRIGDLRAHGFHTDAVFALAEEAIDPAAAAKIASWRLRELKDFLLGAEEEEFRPLLAGLSSDVIACLVKLMSNQELVELGAKVFNPLPGSKIGAKGYLGARVQPNSPTDNVDDIRWQVFCGWSYAVGDLMLGTNPVSSDRDSVAAIEKALQEVLATFGLGETLPHCVLAHIDVQAAAEAAYPGSTALYFQSLGSTVEANGTFDVTVEKMKAYAAQRQGRFGLYFETGQGADATNGHGAGFDMVLHESRKYGFARALRRRVGEAQAAAGQKVAPWVCLNDVAGFIGPEVFRSREQLVRCCLEDTVMGKLHGLPIGLDICSTLHMDVDLDDLDWCIEQVMPANPAYLMALPTKNDPMLSYLTTAFQDHVRVRERFGYRVDDAMWAFFKRLGVIGADGRPTENFGDPNWVYLQYCRAKGDRREEAAIRAEGESQIAECEARGVFIARDHGKNRWDLQPALDVKVRELYLDAKKSIWAELPESFPKTLPAGVPVATRSAGREDYILHPPTGEKLSDKAATEIAKLAVRHAGAYDVQLVISDGLDALALTDPGHLQPYLDTLLPALEGAGFKAAPEQIVVKTGRVRAGYQIGELLYGRLEASEKPRAILHLIGERPGSGHRAYSVYITAPRAAVWSSGKVDHDITRVISGIADTALDPALAARQTVGLLGELVAQQS
jgi:ethanolamine ammonia-lyase large subunit